MSAEWSRAARVAIWRSWERVAAVVGCVEGEDVARRILPGTTAGGDVMVGRGEGVRIGGGCVGCEFWVCLVWGC